MRITTIHRIKTVFILASLMGLVLAGGCLPKPASESSGGVNITLYGFSIMKESLEKAIYPAFAAKWKQEHGQDVHFTSSFAESETVTNQILQGVKAQVAILSIDRDAQRLKDGGLLTSDWHALPQKGIINKTPFVILVRNGNPKGIHDFADLGKPGIMLVHPDPISSGGPSGRFSQSMAQNSSSLKNRPARKTWPVPYKLFERFGATYSPVLDLPAKPGPHLNSATAMRS